VRCLGKPPGLRPGIIAAARRHLKELRPAVVHTHQIGALLYTGWAVARVPFVHTEHGKQYTERRRSRWLGRLAAPRVRRFFCVSADIAADVIRYRVAPARKVAVVPNGIETARFAAPGDSAAVRWSLGIPAGAAVVGTVGNLRAVKCHDVLIRGFARLRGEGPDAPHLVIVGDGPRRDYLRRVAADAGILPRVHFVGYQASPARFLAAMDVFALTSESEGMPLSVLEAWAAGLPVVASRVAGLPELIDPGRTGLLFEVGDDAALGRCLDDLVRDARRARRIGEAARAHVRARYDVSAMAENYHHRYLEVLGGGGPRGGRGDVLPLRVTGPGSGAWTDGGSPAGGRGAAPPREPGNVGSRNHPRRPCA
jgi:glycosyltransferase involved in cell wall biosynthesis